MTAQEVIYALKEFYNVPLNTHVVIFKDDEQFEIKSISVERADGDHQSAVVIQI